MVVVKWNIVIFIASALISGLEGRKLYDDNLNDEDDSLDCNDGRKIDDPILLPFFEKLREQEMIPSRMKKWIIFFDEDENEDVKSFGEVWNQMYLTEYGISKENQGLPFGRVFHAHGKNVYLPRLTPMSDEWTEFRVMYAEQLLLDAVEEVQIYIKYDPTQKSPPPLSKSATRMLQKLMKRSTVKKIYFVDSECDAKCSRATDNPLIKLVSCGSVFGKSVTVDCKNPEGEDIFEGFEGGRYKSVNEPEFQVDLPNNLKRELHKIMDWLLNRIAQRMRNYMEMAFAKNRFRKTPTDLYNKVNLQISKIRGGQTFEASKSADLIYNSLFDLNVYLNVTNTPYTFDKFASFNRYLNYIGRFTKWQLDTTKYANFFEPLKEICLRYIGNGALLVKPASKIFELEEGVYDLTGAICHENVLYVINGLATMNTIKSGIYDNENCPFDTVFVLAKKNFTINENLRLAGKNLAIFSPAWIIVREQTIDLSGNAGKIGEGGANGGDFYAFGTKFERSDLLTVISKGGDGGAGKDAEDVFDRYFFDLDGDDCVPRETEKLIERYGATFGGQGGLSGAITLKFTRNPVLNVTVIRDDGKNGEDGVLKNITVNCGRKSAIVPVDALRESGVTTKRIQKMKESDVLELFRKIIRKNSRRLSYEVLAFYKDIWTSPLMGQSLDSTLRDFLKASDFSKDSREFYEVTSQILHAQIKYTCNMSESQRVLLDFALATIRMESPTEGVLPSVIDIRGYLREVSDRVGTSEIRSEYFEKKEAKFRKIIEEANNYLKASLLPSLKATVENMHAYLQEERYASRVGIQGEEHFQECLVMNTLLRYLASLFEHVQLGLNDFVTPLEESDFEELNSEGFKKKLYFYRHVRNNMTANQMKSLQEFLKLLKAGVDDSTGNLCFDCREEIRNALKELTTVKPRNEECDRIAKYLMDRSKQEIREQPRFDKLNCRECNGNCTLCGWCRSCQIRCDSCRDCDRCPWCVKCVDPQQEYCSACPECPLCGLAGKVLTDGSTCLECNNCHRCPNCDKCEEDPKQICDACQNCDLCRQCPRCISDNGCRRCRDCAICPRCPQCRVRVNHRDCNSVIHARNRRFFSGANLCRRCPCSVCRSCPGCQLRPEFDEIDRDVFFGLNSWKSTPPRNRIDMVSRRTHVPAAERQRVNLARALEGYLYRDGALPRPPPPPPPIGRATSDEGFETEVTQSKESQGGNAYRDSLPGDRALWLQCLNSVGSYVDKLFEQSGGTCNGKLQSACTSTLKSLGKIIGRVPGEESAAPKKTAIRLKCPKCNDTVDFFFEKLSFEMNKCRGESNYNYRELESLCSPNEGVLFHMSGCDPETFSRTYDEIRENFLKEFYQYVTVDEDHSRGLNNIPRNFVYLLTNVEMFLTEGMPLTTANVDAILRVTESLVKFEDLKREYAKKMTELHDFSETDVYDLFAAELSMQNERLDLTSRWLSQLKKLVPWIKKVTAFLATDVKFQEVNEKIVEAVRLVSEIVHNVKVVEHYRNLRDYMNRVKKVDKMRAQGVSKFKPAFEKTFIADVFNKAIKISENWMFPLSKSVAELRATLREMKNSTYRSQLNAVAKQIENHRKAISLYTSTQSSDSVEEKTLFYKWNVRTRPTLLDDLFGGKPVILVSEILDGGKVNSLTAKNFEMKLVAGRRQKEGAQRQIDEALLGSRLNITHSGISYFKFGSRIYRRLTETFTFRHAAPSPNRTKIVQDIDFVLSPYTTWILRLESDLGGSFPVEIKNKIGGIELYGTGRYVVNCADIPDVNQNFYPLTDYRRRNGK